MPTPYYESDCAPGVFGISQKLVIPTTPELEFFLNPDDLQYQDQDAGINVSIKYDRFTRDIGAVIPSFRITLQGITASVVEQITNFAETDFLNKVLVNGKGSINLYYKNEELTDLYIQPPIEKSNSWFRNWENPPTEIFDTITLTLISPNPKWY